MFSYGCTGCGNVFAEVRDDCDGMCLCDDCYRGVMNFKHSLFINRGIPLHSLNVDGENVYATET